MRILEKTEMKRLPGSFSCVFQFKRHDRCTEFVDWLKNENLLYEHLDYNLLRTVITDEQLTMLALTFAE